MDIYQQQQERYAAKTRELNGFGDERLNQLAKDYVQGNPEQKEKAYAQLQRHYPGLEGEEMNLSPQAAMIIESTKMDINNDDDTFGPDDL